jgi:hypothetical protein
VRVARVKYDFNKNKVVSQKNELVLQKDYEKYLRKFLDGVFED